MAYRATRPPRCAPPAGVSLFLSHPSRTTASLEPDGSHDMPTMSSETSAPSSPVNWGSSTGRSCAASAGPRLGRCTADTCPRPRRVVTSSVAPAPSPPSCRFGSSGGGSGPHAAAITAAPSVHHFAAVHPSVSHSVNPPVGCDAKRYRPHGDHASPLTPATPDAMEHLAPVLTSHTAVARLSADPAASNRPHGDQHTQSYGRPPAKSPSCLLFVSNNSRGRPHPPGPGAGIMAPSVDTTRPSPVTAGDVYGSTSVREAREASASSLRCVSRHSGAPPMRFNPGDLPRPDETDLPPAVEDAPDAAAPGSCAQTQTPWDPATARVAPALGRHATARAPE